jgi:glucokinase
MDMFVGLYGAEAGNVALKFLARGGIYIGGGIAPKIVDFLRRPIFMERFLDKGRMRDVLEGIPVRVIVREGVALLGTARYAARVAGAHAPVR